MLWQAFSVISLAIQRGAECPPTWSPRHLLRQLVQKRVNGLVLAIQSCLGATDSERRLYFSRWPQHLLHPLLTTLGNFEVSGLSESVAGTRDRNVIRLFFTLRNKNGLAKLFSETILWRLFETMKGYFGDFLRLKLPPKNRLNNLRNADITCKVSF